MNHEYFMREALKEAQMAGEDGDVPVGAVVVCDNRIIGRARNQVEILKDPTAHAEMIALTQASASLETERLINATMYVTLEPCVMCAGALVHARIKELFYATPDPKTGACGSVYNIISDPRLNHQVKVIYGLLREEAEVLLQDFFKKVREKTN